MTLYKILLYFLMSNTWSCDPREPMFWYQTTSKLKLSIPPHVFLFYSKSLKRGCTPVSPSANLTFLLCCVFLRLCWSEPCWSILNAQRWSWCTAWLWSAGFFSLSWHAPGLWLWCGLSTTARPHASGEPRSLSPSRKSCDCAALKTSAPERWDAC